MIGTTLFHFPSIGKLTSFTKTVQGFLLIIVLPAFIYIGFELWNIKNEIEKNTERKIKESDNRE